MKNFLTIILLALIISSCEEILDINPTDRLSDAAVWTDASLVELYVNGTYNAIPHGFYQHLWSSLSDETYNIHNGNSYTVLRGELTPDNVGTVSGLFDYWKTAYSNIRNMNIFFLKIDDVAMDEALKKRMKGEMKFINAAIYANLIWRYGGVPIIKDVFELGADYSVSRNSYDECVNHICSELDEAITLLPAKQAANQAGRASGHAAMALKARVLLYAASSLNNPSNDLVKWQKASDAATALLNTGYDLQADYQGIFLKDNTEIIFARSFSQSNINNIHLWNGRNGSNGWGGNCPTQNLVNDYEMLNGELPYSDPDFQVINPASGYDPANPYVDRDPRFYASILYDGAVWMGRETQTFKNGLDSRGSSVDAWNATLTGYYLKKFLPPDLPPAGTTLKPTSPWIFFRFAEVILNYAEAEFELGHEDIAREYLNKLRTRAGMPLITATGEDLRQKIYHERRIELVFEGHRFHDVRRWKIASETEKKSLFAMQIIKEPDESKTYTVIELLKRDFLEQHYLLPIPRVEIDRSLGSLSQNPGYN
jgi:starch-binding outer membrane protein, SusD/RagB family